MDQTTQIFSYMQKEIVNQALTTIMQFVMTLQRVWIFWRVLQKKYALNKTQNMLKIIHDTIFFIRP